MAKVNAPLLSFKARGQLAKSMVFFPWKGVNAVRQYVVPANPKSDPQITQRDYMTQAVAEWHAANYSSEDVVAWNRYAGTLAQIMSGFNAMIKNHIQEQIKGNVWTRMKLKEIVGLGTTGFTVTIYKEAGGVEPYILYGTRKTHLPNDGGFTSNLDGTWTKAVSGLVANTLYYFTFEGGVSGTDFGKAGLYQVRTLAA